MRRAWLWLLEQATRMLGRLFVRGRSTDEVGKRTPPRNDMYPMW